MGIFQPYLFSVSLIYDSLTSISDRHCMGASKSYFPLSPFSALGKLFCGDGFCCCHCVLNQWYTKQLLFLNNLDLEAVPLLHCSAKQFSLMSWRPGIPCACSPRSCSEFPVEKPLVCHRVILDGTSVERIKFCLRVHLFCSHDHNRITLLSYCIIWRWRSGKSWFTILLPVEEIGYSCSTMLSQKLFILRLKDCRLKLSNAGTNPKQKVQSLLTGLVLRNPHELFQTIHSSRINNSWFSWFLFVL